MSISRCPHCHLPYLPAEVVAGACPTCGLRMITEPPPAPVAPPPPPKSAWSRLLIASMIGLVLIALGGWLTMVWLQQFSGDPSDGGDTKQQASTTKESRKSVKKTLAANKQSSPPLPIANKTTPGKASSAPKTTQPDPDKPAKKPVTPNDPVNPAPPKILPDLRVLDLSRSKVNDKDLERLTNIPDLRTLLLAGTNVTGAGLQHFKSLIQLDLSATLVTDKSLAKLAGLKQLRTLTLQATKITGSGLAALTGLNRLDLSGTDFGDKSVRYLLKLKQLRVLVLKDTKVTGANLGKLKGLVTLDLRGTPLTDRGLEQIYGLTELRVLYLADTQVSTQGVRTLEKVLPSLKVFMSP